MAMPASAQIASNVLFGGQPMAPYASAEGGSCRVLVYGQTAPASGAGMVTARISPSTAPIILAAASYDGVYQTLPTDDTSAQASGSTAAASGSIYSSDGLGFGALCASGSMIAATPRAGQHSVGNRVSGALVGAASDVTGGTVNWQLSATGGIDWAVASIPIRSAPGGAGPAPDAGASVTDADPAPDASAEADAAGAPDAAVKPDAANELDAAAPPGPRDAAADGPVLALPLPPVGEETPDAAPRAIDLVVATGCRSAGAAGAAGPGALALAGVALLVMVARRRRQ
jgi:MYXO-CTERM domain-containing protein